MSFLKEGNTIDLLVTCTFTAIITGVEYGLKQFYENFLDISKMSPHKIYLLYRCLHFIILAALFCLVFGPARLWYLWPLMAFIFVLLGTSELIPCLLSKIIYEHCGIKNRLLYFLPMFILVIAGLAVPSWLNLQFSPLFLNICNFLNKNFPRDFPHPHYALFTISVFIFLAHTANYIIRWLTAKAEDTTLPEPVCGFPAGYISGRSKATLSYQESALANSEEILAAPGRETLKAGRIIGILERWLIVIFILMRQFGLIGFVLTAKSIARFKKFEEPLFAEYYLMGTLYSTLIAVLFSLILLNA